MLQLLRSNLAFTLVVCLLLAATHLAVYQRGASNERLACSNARIEAEQQVAQSLAHLAHQYAQADAEASMQTTKSRRLAREVTEIRDDAFKILSNTGCIVDEPRRLLIYDAYCSRFSSAPICLPD